MKRRQKTALFGTLFDSLSTAIPPHAPSVNGSEAALPSLHFGMTYFSTSTTKVIGRAKHLRDRYMAHGEPFHPTDFRLRAF
jgi:hypothetical protein